MQRPEPSPEGWGCIGGHWVQAGSRCWAGARPGCARCGQLRTAGTRVLPTRPGSAVPGTWLPLGRAARLSPAGSGCRHCFLRRQSRGRDPVGERGNRKPQVRPGRRAAGGVPGVLLPGAGAMCWGRGHRPSSPPDPRSTCRSIPRRGTAASGLTLTPQGCCLLWPQPHVPSLCWVRSVTALVGARRVPALHPQLAIGPAFAPRPSSLPFPQDAGCRMAPPEPAQSGGLQPVPLCCRKSRGGGKTLHQRALGTPQGPGAGLPLPGCSPARPQQLHGPAAPRAPAVSSRGWQGPCPLPAPGWRQQEGRGQSWDKPQQRRLWRRERGIEGLPWQTAESPLKPGMNLLPPGERKVGPLPHKN